MNEGKRCDDAKCLYYTDSLTHQKKFSFVTAKTREGEGLWEKCNHCGLVINRNGVPIDEIKEFYNSTYIANNSYSEGELLSARDHFNERLSTVQSIADFLDTWLDKTKTVFELGAATGELLYLLKDKANYCFGNEINQLYTSFIRNELAIEASSDDYLELEFRKKFDCVIAINTLDHLHNPIQTVEKIFGDLCDGGLFYIEVPNDNQALRVYLEEPYRTMFEEFMYQRAHYYSFNSKTIGELLSQTGFTILEEFSKHDYTLFNYLQWYFTGQSQKMLRTAMNDTSIHGGQSGFESDMNELFADLNRKFKETIERWRVGELICILARKPF